MQIQFKDVSKSFYSISEKTDVLYKINFEVKQGQIVALVGPSGCGKSTLLNLICKLIKPDEGEVIVNGKIGYMFQHDNLLPWRNVYKNITLGPEISKSKIDEKQINETIEKYGLKDFKDYYPKELSGGMRQRVALIRTLVLKPDILLLDEPFSSLDYQSKITVQEDMYKIIKNEKKTTILVTHDITEAIAMADVVYVLTSRPSSIKKKFMINLTIDGEKTPLKARNCEEFKQYFSEIWKELNNE